MMPYASGAGWELWHGDSMDSMPCADAVITDPPYGLGFRGAAWDGEIPDWLTEAQRIAPIVAFTTAPMTQWDYPRPDWVNCWQRPGAQSRTAAGGFSHWTPILVYGRVKFPVDCFRLAACTAGMEHRRQGIAHPSPKPVSLMSWLVANCAPVGGTVLDPFAGSGSTGVACIETGRAFIGIEQSEEYCAIAARRLSAAAPPLQVAA